MGGASLLSHATHCNISLNHYDMFSSVYRAFLSMCISGKDDLQILCVYGTLLSVYRALLNVCAAFLSVYRALLSIFMSGQNDLHILMIL